MNILHLSDIHFGRSNPIYRIDDPFERHDEILDSLIDEVTGLDASLRPEHIVVTGDIAWRGKKSEFKAAAVFFKKLLNALKLKGTDFSFCVGNHDVDLSYKCVPDEIGDWSVKEVDECYRYENIYRYEASIHEYNRFCAEMGVVPYIYPVDDSYNYSYSCGYKDVPMKDGQTLRLAAFNTSMLIAGKNISKDKNWLGLPQIEAMIEHNIIPDKESVDYTIGLFHHPVNYMNPNEVSGYDGRPATYSLLLKNLDLLLCGHTESAANPYLMKVAGGATIISSGACYYNDVYPNTFHMLYPSGENRTVGFLSYIHDASGWHEWDYFNTGEMSYKKMISADKKNFLYHSKLRFHKGADSYEVTVGVASYRKKADGSLAFENHTDHLSPYLMTCDERLEILLSPYRSMEVKAIRRYKQLWDFCENWDPMECSWELVDSADKIIRNGRELLITPGAEYDWELIEKLRVISKHFEVDFKLPDEISEIEYEKIRAFYKYVTEGYSLIKYDKEFIEIECDYDKLVTLYETALDKNEFFVTSFARSKVELFGVVMDFRNLTFYSGPYRTETLTLKRKIDGFCEGDKRICVLKADHADTYIIKDVKAFEEKCGLMKTGSSVVSIQL